MRGGGPEYSELAEGGKGYNFSELLHLKTWLGGGGGGERKLFRMLGEGDQE